MPQISVISFTVIRLRERWSSNSKNADWIALFVMLVFAIAIHLFCVYTMLTLSVQGATRFFGAEMPSSRVILVAGRQPGCLVCLAGLPFPLPKNSEGLSGEHQLGLARKRMQVG